MAQSIQEHWIITENVVRFQQQLKEEPDIIRRRMLERLLEQEREKLNAKSPE